MWSSPNFESPLPVEYLVCNQDFTITDCSSGIVDLLVGAVHQTSSCQSGQDVRACLPELIGLENVIAEILQQQRLNFDLVGLQQSEDRFIDLSLRCFPPGSCPLSQRSLMVFVKDSSDRMQLEKHFSQITKEYDLARQELSLAKDYLNQLLHYMSDALLVTDDQGRIKQANLAALKIFKYKESELINQPLAILAQNAVSKSLTKKEVYGDDFEVECLTQSGEGITMSFACSSLINQMTGEQDFLYIGRDVSHRKRAEQKLIDLANKDGLTRLANRYFFDQRLQQFWQQSIADSQPFSLLLCDVDFFKAYNDYYGHLQGDECLRKVGEILLDLTQENNFFAARYGGEEFALLLPNTPHELLSNIAEQIRASLQKYALPHPHSLVAKIVTISIGGATFKPTEQLKKPMELIQQADQALYRAKNLGRNCYYSYDSEHTDNP